MLRNVFSIILVVLSISFGASAQMRPPRQTFTDNNLEALLAYSEIYKTSGVIYTWSPRMNLSIIGGVELAQIARDLKIDMTVLVDPAVSEQEIAQYRHVPEIQNSYWLSSLYLYRLGITQHYPAVVLYKNGKLLAPLRPGYDEPARVRDYIMRRLR